MGAVVGEEPHSTALVEEEDEVLAQHPNVFRGTIRADVRHKCDGMPVAAKKLTARRPRTHLRKESVFLRGQHGSPPKIVVLSIDDAYPRARLPRYRSSREPFWDPPYNGRQHWPQCRS